MTMEQPIFTRNLKAVLLTRAVMAAGGALSHMSDASLLRLARALRAVASDPNLRFGLDEIIDALRSGPPNTTLIRRLLAESKYDELYDFVRGAIRGEKLDFEDL